MSLIVYYFFLKFKNIYKRRLSSDKIVFNQNFPVKLVSESKGGTQALWTQKGWKFYCLILDFLILLCYFFFTWGHFFTHLCS